MYLNQDLTSYANANKTQTAMMALDNEKIFDKVDWQFLKALQNFAYGLEIIKKIKTVYQTNKQTQIKVNGHFLQRGVRQGCSLFHDSVHCICRNIIREYKTK